MQKMQFITKKGIKYKIKNYPAEKVKRIKTILEFLRKKGFGVPKAEYKKNSILFEYVKGKSLEEIKLTPEIIDSAAKLLAKLNNLDYSTLKLEKTDKLITSFNKKVDRKYSKTEATRIKNKHNRLKPQNIEYSLGHFDYKLGNIIYYKGKVTMIDFEGLSIGPKAVDVAKAYYHFGKHGKTFLKSYAKYGDLTHYKKHREFYDFREQALNK